MDKIKFVKKYGNVLNTLIEELESIQEKVSDLRNSLVEESNTCDAIVKEKVDANKFFDNID